MSWLSDIWRRRRPPRRLYLGLSTGLSFGLAALVLVLLVTRFDVDLAGTWEKLKASNLLLFALAVLVHYTTFIFRGLRWRVLLRNVEGDDSRVPSALYCGRLVLLASFVNSVTWFHLGDAYRAYAYVGDTGQSFSRTIGTVLAERFFDVVTVFLLVIVAALLLVASGTSISWMFVGLAAVLVAGLLALLVAMGLFRGRLANRLPGRLREAYHRFHQGTLGSFQQLPLVASLSLLAWLAEVGRLYLVSEAVGVDISIGLVVFATVANSLLTLVPLTPGGLGLVEPGVISLLMVSSVEKIQAVPLVLLDRSISYLSVIIVGGAVFLTTQLLRRRLPARSSALAKEG